YRRVVRWHHATGYRVLTTPCTWKFCHFHRCGHHRCSPRSSRQTIADRSALQGLGKLRQRAALEARTRTPGRRMTCHHRGRATGLDHLHPNMARHSFATHLLEGVADLAVIAELLGHARMETTERYTRVAPERLREVLAAVSSTGSGASDPVVR